MSHYGLHIRRACRLIKQSYSVQYYQSVKDPKLALRSRMREIAQTRVRYGCRRVHVLLKREGWQLGKKPDGPALQRRAAATTVQVAQATQDGGDTSGQIKPTKPNEAWSMDFVADQLANG